jgi:hypothetical protein
MQGEHVMKTSVSAGSMRAACAVLLIAAAACQLNDTDSAPPAPELGDETERASSPAQIGPVSAARSPSSSTNASSDAGTSTSADAAATTGNELPPGSLADAAADAANPFSTPVLPVLPGLEAGVLPPGTLSPPAIGDAAAFVGD